MTLLLSLTLSAWANPTCGQVLTANTTLDGDLDCSSLAVGTPALVLNASNITLDGAGFRILTANGGTAIRVAQNRTGVAITDVDVSASTGTGVGIAIAQNVGTLAVSQVTASGRAFGIDKGTNTGTNQTNLTLTDVDVSGSASAGVRINRLSGLSLSNVTFDNSATGLAFRNCASGSPFTLDLATSSFDGVTNLLVDAHTCAGTVIDGLSGIGAEPTATAIDVQGTSNVTIRDLLFCEGANGVRTTATNAGLVLDNAVISSVDTALVLNTATSNSTGTILVTGNVTDISDAGTNNTVAAVAAADLDADGLADACDPCVDVDADTLCAADDPDDDNDGVLDADDSDPNDPTVCADTDGDLCDDCDSGSFLPSADGADFEADGLCDLGDPDDDNDTVPDGDDADPFDATVCSDTDFDGCDDCDGGTFNPADDGADTDTDGVCDPADLVIDPSVNFDKTMVSWNGFASFGVGSPTVVFDSVANRFVMVYETQIASTATQSDCPAGVWALGLATSVDGKTWVDAGGPLVQPVPQSGTYYECVAAHPTLVNRDSNGFLTMFFKAEQGKTPSAAAPWGTSRFTGIGRVLIVWNPVLETYAATVPDASPVLALGASGENLGFPRGLFADGQYLLALTQVPDMRVASGLASSLTLDPTPVWQPGDAAWTPDEVYNPAVACEADGSFSAFVGGRDLSVTGTVLASSVGRLTAPATDFSDWSIGAGPIFDTALSGDVEMRHWDVLRVGTSDFLFYFSDRTGPGGTNRIGLASTSLTWSPSSVQSKVCP